MGGRRGVIRDSFDFENWAWREIAKDADRARAEADKYDESLKRSAESLYAATDAGRFDTLNKSLATAQEAFNRGFIDQDKLDAINNSLLGTSEHLKQQSMLASDLGMTFSSAFEDAIVGGKGLSETLQGLATDIERILVRRTITEPLADAIGRTFSFGNLFSFANGGVMTAYGPLPLKSYASGGIASSPQLALFGEGRQPEAFVPLPDGRRIPVAMQGGSNNVQVIVNNNMPGARATARERNDGGNRIIEVMVEQVEAAIAGNVSSGRGLLAGVLSSTYGLNRSAGGH